MATKEFKRVGPVCEGCGRPRPVSGIPSSAEDLAKLEARLARLQAKVTAGKGIVLVPTKKVAPAAE
jgi:hypothetical protein